MSEWKYHGWAFWSRILAAIAATAAVGLLMNAVLSFILGK
jgi:hypothetical protein